MVSDGSRNLERARMLEEATATVGLPDELWCDILDLLPPMEMVLARGVCNKWNSYMSENEDVYRILDQARYLLHRQEVLRNPYPYEFPVGLGRSCDCLFDCSVRI